MIKKVTRNTRRVKRHKRTMKKFQGSAEKPRLSVFRSLKNIYAQVIDDQAGKTLVSASTASKKFKNKENTCTIATAKEVGTVLAEECLKNNIKKVIFDKNGYKYHGKIKALADACREGGLAF